MLIKSSKTLTKMCFWSPLSEIFGDKLNLNWVDTNLERSPGDTNGVDASVLRWLTLSIIIEFILRTWRAEHSNKEPKWRKKILKDLDGKTKRDRAQRLIRWDRRPPNEILLNGFLPQVVDSSPTDSETNLYNFVKKNSKSIFVSTTKQQFKSNGNKGKIWTPRSISTGIIYEYEIFAPGGIEINESFGNNSPWPNQHEVTFPGGIRPEFIRSVREFHNGNVVRIWENPNFLPVLDGSTRLPAIQSRSTTPFLRWRPDHPDGNNKDNPDAYNVYNPDKDMYGENGDLQEDSFIPNEHNRFIPNGLFQIKSKKNQGVVVEYKISTSKVHAYTNLTLNNQTWKFQYYEDNECYTIEYPYPNPNSISLLSIDPHQSGEQIFVKEYSNNTLHIPDSSYWRLIRTEDGFYQLENLADLNLVIDLANGETENGTKILAYPFNGGDNQKWDISPVYYRPLENGEYRIKSSIDQHIVVDYATPTDNIHAYTNLFLDNQIWLFTYSSSKMAYTIEYQHPSDTSARYLITAKGEESGEQLVLHKYDKGNNISSNSYWRLTRDGTGYFQLQNVRNLAQVMDLEGGKTQNGTKIQLYQNNQTNAQYWNIEPINYDFLTNGLGGVHCQIKSSLDRNLLIDTTGTSVLPGENNTSRTQIWFFNYDSKKKAYTISYNNPVSYDYYLCTESMQIGTVLVVKKYTGIKPDSSYWRLIRTEEGYYQLQNLGNLKRVINLADSNTENLRRIQLDDNNATMAQKWSIEIIDKKLFNDGIYTISTKLNYKKVIDYYEDNNSIRIYDYMPISNQLWKIEYYPEIKPSCYKIRSNRIPELGLYYQNEHYPVSVNYIDKNENDYRAYWIIEYVHETGGYAIRSLYRPNQLIDLKDSNTENENEIITNKLHFGKNQLWNIAPTEE
ncbi:RICIN domain-containing protein [Bacillus bombysepticus]|nr:RICIN domain-containing protein [Bacillus cereus]TKH27703.1 RICIN domain-containing protein [Bacillus cereus]